MRNKIIKSISLLLAVLLLLPPPAMAEGVVMNANSGLTMANGAGIRLIGNWSTAATGTITPGDSTVKFEAASGTKTITLNGEDFDNVTFDDGGGGATFQIQDAFDANGDVTITGGSLDGNSQAMTVGGNWTNSDIFTSGTNIVTFDGASTQTINAGGTGDATKDFNSVSVTGSTLQLTGSALEIDDTLTVAATKVIDLNGQNLTVVTVDNPGTIQLEGGETVTITTMDTAEGTVLIDGTVSVTVPAFNNTVYNLTFDEDGTSDPTFTLPDVAFDVNGTLTVTDATVALDDDKDLTVTDMGATGTAITVATSQTLSNSGTANVTLGGGVSNAGTIAFDSSGGGGGDADSIQIRSTVAGTRRNWQGAGTFTMLDVDVKDQTAIGGTPATIATTSATNSGNNVNWLFGGSIDFDGIAYTAKSETTRLTSAPLRLCHWNGSVATYYTGTTHVTTGAFSFSMTNVSAGDAVIIYVDDGAAEGNLVYVSDGADVADLKLYADEVALRDDNSGAVTNTNMGLVDDTDDDIKYAVSGGNLTVEDDFELFIFSGTTFTPGGAVVVNDIDINGTFTMAANAVTVSGSWDATGGSYSSSGTVTFDAGSTSETITSDGDTFNHIVFDDSAGTATFTLGDTLDVNGNLTITGGTFVTANNAITLAGNWVNSDIFTSGSGTVTFDGGSTQTINAGGTGDGNKDFNNISVTGSTLQLITSALEIDGTLTVAASKVIDLNGQNMTVATVDNPGTIQLEGGETFTVTTMDTAEGTVLIDGTTSTIIPSFNGTVFNITFDESATSDPTYTLADANLTVNGVMTVTDGTVAFDNDKNLIFGGAAASVLSVGASGILSNTGTGDLTLSSGVANAGTITFDSSDDGGDGITIASTAAAGRDWTGAGTFNMTDVTASYQTANSGTPPYVFVASGTNSGNNTNWIFGGGALTATNVEPASLVAGAEGDVTVSFTLANVFPVDGKLVIDFGSGFDATGLVSIVNSVGMDGGWTIGVTNGDGTGDVVTLTRDGTGTQLAATTAIVLVLEDQVRNPQVSGSTGVYSIETQLNTGVTVDADAAVSADTITPGALTATAVTPANLFRNATNDVTVTFTTANPIPSDGVIKVTFPTNLGVGFTFDSGGTTAATINSGFDGSLAVSAAANVLSITRSGGSSSAAGAKSIELTFITNPDVIGTTDPFDITTTISGGGIIDQDAAVAGLVIVAQPTASVPAFLDINGLDTTSYTLSSVDTPLIYIQVNDEDENDSSLIADTVTVTLTSESGDSETLTLTETTLSSGIYTIDPIVYDVDDPIVTGNGILETRNGDTITLSYVDDDDPTDATSDTAVIVASERMILMTLTATPESAKIGELVTFSATLKNESNAALTGFDIVARLPQGMVVRPGSGKISAGSFSAVEIGSTVVFSSLSDLPADETRTLTFQSILGSNVSPGAHTAAIFARVNPVISNTANVTLVIRPDPLFHIGTLIGKVFWDINKNGVQDGGEIGIPNAVVATEQGYVITTDQYGRYHIPDFLSGRHMIKIDRSSMPDGTKLTTPEAVVVNQTDAMLSKVNFGVIIPDEAAKLYDIERESDVEIQLEKDTSAIRKSMGLEFHRIIPSETKNKLQQNIGNVFQTELYDAQPKLPFRIQSNYAQYVKSWTFEIGQYREEKEGLLSQTAKKSREIIAVAREVGSPVASTFEYTWDHPLMDENEEPLNYEIKVTMKDREDNEDVVIYDLEWDASTEGMEWTLEESDRIEGIKVKGTGVNIRGVTHANKVVSIYGKETLSSSRGEFADHIILPQGEHEIPIHLYLAYGQPPTVVKRHIDLKDTYLFFVGFTEMEYGQLDIAGSIQSVSEEDKAHFNDTWYDESRIAYYLKGKIKGKYLITASIDTDRKKAELFRNLEEEEYYAVYGDGSSLQANAHDSQDEYYLLVQADANYLQYGNFNTGFTGTEFADFERSLHGGKFHYETLTSAFDSKPHTAITLFHAKARQNAAVNEFTATGGSLYYMKHKDIIMGSEKVKAIARDKNTGIPKDEKILVPGIDYTFDYDEGRLRLYHPLTTFTFEDDSIITQNSLPGNPQYIKVDYEYEPKNPVEDVTRGARGTHVPWGNFLRIGGTIVEEKRPLEQYTVAGYDGTMRLPLNSLVRAEYAESSAGAVGTFISHDGGFDFDEVVVPANEGDVASAFKWDFNSNPWRGANAQAYYRDIQSDFSTTGTMAEAGASKFGYGGTQNLGSWGGATYTYESIRLHAGAPEAIFGQNETGEDPLDPNQSQLLGESISFQYKVKKGKFDATAEFTEDISELGHTKLVAAEAGYQIGSKTRLAITGQADLMAKNNDQLRSTLQHDINDTTKLQAIHTYGPEGEGTLIGVDTGFLGHNYRYAKGFGTLLDQSEKPDLSHFTDDYKRMQERLTSLSPKKEFSTELALNKVVDKDTEIGIKQTVTDKGLGKRVLHIAKKTDDGRVLELVRESNDTEHITSYTENIPVSPQVTKYTQSTTTSNILTKTSDSTELTGTRVKLLDDRGSLYKEDERSISGDSIKEASRLGAEIAFSEHGVADFSYQRTQDGSLEATDRNFPEHHVAKLSIDYFEFDKIAIHDEWEVKYDDDLVDKAAIISSGEMEIKASQDWTLLGRYEWSWSKEIQTQLERARFSEVQAGFAYRPVENDRLNILGEYKYVSDDAPDSQLDLTAVNTTHRQILRGELSYDLTPQIQFVEKLAVRDNRFTFTDEELIQSRTYLTAHRINYRVTDRLDFGAEYRLIGQSLAKDRTNGFLFETSYRFTDSLRVAVGYADKKFKSEIASDMNVQASGMYVRLFYDAIEEAKGLLDGRRNDTMAVAKELEKELVQVTQIDGREKDIQEISARLNYARELMDRALYQEAADVLSQGLELYQTAQMYSDRAVENENRFKFYKAQGEMFYRHALYDQAFTNLEKAYAINAFDQGLLELMSATRTEIQKRHKIKRDIRKSQREYLQKIKGYKESGKIILESIRMHYEFGKRYADEGMYEEAMEEWTKGMAIANRVSDDESYLEASRHTVLSRLEILNERAKELYKDGKYAEAKEMLKEGAEIIREME